MKLITCIFLFFVLICKVDADDGYRLWLRYDKIENNNLLQQYGANISSVRSAGTTASVTIATNELLTGLQGLLGKKIPLTTTNNNGTVLIAAKSAAGQTAITSGIAYNQLGSEGFAIRSIATAGKNL